MKILKLISSQRVLVFSHQELVLFSICRLGQKELGCILLLWRKVPSFKEYFSSFFLIMIVDGQPFFRPKLLTYGADAHRSFANRVILALRHRIEKFQVTTDVKNWDHNWVDLLNGRQ